MRYKHWIIMLLVLIGLQFAAVPALACSGDFRQTTIQEHVDDADVILIGTVTGSNSDNPYDAAYSIQVESYMKGEGPDAVLVTDYGTGGGDCMNVLQLNDRVILLLDGNPAEDEVLHASYLQVYDAVWAPSEERIADITAVTGHAPTQPYSTPLWGVIKYWTYSPTFKAIALIGTPLVVVASGLIILNARKRRQSKKKNS